MANLLATFLLGGAFLFFGLSFAVDATGYGVLVNGIFEDYLPARISVAMVLAFAFTLAKALFCAIIAWSRHHRQKAPRRAIWALRAVVVVNSMVISLLVLSANLVSPEAQSLLDTARREVNREGMRDERAATLWLDTVKQVLLADRDLALDALDTFYIPRIAEAERERRAQMDIGGQKFKGALFSEFDAQIGKLTDEWKAETARVNTTFRTALAAAETKARARRDAALAREKEAMDALTIDRFTGTTEAQNPHLVRLTEMLNSARGQDWIDPILAGMFLTLTAALVIEFAPLVLLGYGLALIFDQGTAQDRRGAGMTAPRHPGPRAVAAPRAPVMPGIAAE